MKLQYVLFLTLVAIGCVLMQNGTRAGDKDKKDPPKKEEFIDIVVNDALTNADLKDKVRAQSFCKTYVLKMTEGKSYQIDMTSADFDSYLRLENKAGEPLAADDDSGGFPNARIIFRAAKTEDFTIIATTYGGGSTGKYRVTVKEVR